MSHPFIQGPGNPDLCAYCTWPEGDVQAHGRGTDGYLVLSTAAEFLRLEDVREPGLYVVEWAHDAQRETATYFGTRIDSNGPHWDREDMYSYDGDSTTVTCVYGPLPDFPSEAPDAAKLRELLEELEDGAIPGATGDLSTVVQRRLREALGIAEPEDTVR